ncbi:MAG: hypothetical protein PHO53_01710 [Actinomycetota bacterium]|nr:hypothetical protein [Actinomycetota bacterium]
MNQDKIPRQEILELLHKEGTKCVSAYMPTHCAIPAVREDKIRLKNFLKKAEKELISLGMRRPEAEKLLEPARKLEENPEFWRKQSNGLALFLSTDILKYYKLPLEFEEVLVVSDRFHLKPLMPILTETMEFYLLALSLNQVKLFQGNRYGVQEVDLEDVPKSLSDVLKREAFEKGLHFHTVIPARVGGSRKKSAIFHGHGGGKEDKKERIQRYFLEISKGMKEFLKGENAPLIIAGVKYLCGYWEEVNTYPNLLKERIHGNPDEWNSTKIFEKAWKILQPHFESLRQREKERYLSLVGTGYTSSEVKEVVPASWKGKVEVIFVPLKVHQWGIYKPEEEIVELHEERGPGDYDLLDFAAVHTYLHGEKVYAVSPEDIPGGGMVAAIFRGAQGGKR